MKIQLVFMRIKNNPYLFFLIIFIAVGSLSSCKKIPRKILGEGTEVVSKKPLKEMDWDGVLKYLKKEHPELSENIKKLDKGMQKSVCNSIKDDARFLESLLSSKNILNDFEAYCSKAPKLAKDVNFLRFYSLSKHAAQRSKKKCFLDDVIVDERMGFVKFTRKSDGAELAKYRNGVMEFDNKIISRNGRFSKNIMFDETYIPNCIYKIRGNDGVLYIFNTDNLGRIYNVKASHLSAKNINENILSRQQNAYFLGEEWETSFNQLKKMSKDNDINAEVKFQFDDNGMPKYAIIESDVKGQKHTIKHKTSLEDVVPFKNGGINKEKRTLKEICQHPLLPQMYETLDNMGLDPSVLKRIKNDLEKMGSNKVPRPSKGGHVNLNDIAWPGINPKLPDKEALIAMIRKNKGNIELADIGERDIRDVSYEIARQALVEKYGITMKQADLLIGNTFDLVIHEAENGVVQIVPNNVHKFKQLYAHKGYVSKMLKQINGKDIVD